MALCFDQNNDVKEENNFDQNIMPYICTSFFSEIAINELSWH